MDERRDYSLTRCRRVLLSIVIVCVIVLDVSAISLTQECSQTEFGCCDDGSTPATSPSKENCADYVIDLNEPATNEFEENTSKGLTCAESKFECCLDGKTYSQGPRFKNCKEVEQFDKSTIVTLDNYAETCLLPEPPKSCFNYSLKWRYDSNEGRCVQFWFGGCDPNNNIFETETECEAKCVQPNGTDICKLPLVVPSKREQAETIRYYYDPAEFKCKPFTYYGVSGNGNNFEFIEECQVSCQVPLTLEQCSLIPEKGPCRGSYERWYFDSKLGICKTFVYGGCLKNNNNHMSEKDCFGTCVKPKQSVVCLLPKMTGNCEKQIVSWYYDFKEGKCKQMFYSGCNGNLNRFESSEACEYTCRDLYSPSSIQAQVEQVCNAPKVMGKCHIELQRWYFNQTTMMCHQFTYSGCDGTSNNFESEADCRLTCNAKETDPCVLPLDHGTCDKYKIYWFFNQATGECDRFYYGGCDGNQNRFDSRHQCEMSCKMSKEEKDRFMRLPKKCIQPLEESVEKCEDDQAPQSIQRWYFDTDMKTCYSFDHTSCNQSSPSYQEVNRFESMEDCSKTCTEKWEVTSDSQSVIVPEVRENSEPRQDSQPQHKEASHHHHHDYQDICEIPITSENCTHKSPKWFYDIDYKYCRQSTVCNENLNSFETRHQCSELCEIPKKKEICNTNVAQGPCTDFKLKWFFDIETKVCREFYYGGCLGNHNMFGSQLDCVNFCWDYLSEEAKEVASNDFDTTSTMTSVTTTTTTSTTTTTQSTTTQSIFTEPSRHVCPSTSHCSEDCSFGRVLDSNKCETCECVDPCEELVCQLDQECLIENGRPICRSDNHGIQEYEPVIIEFRDKIELKPGESVYLPCKVVSPSGASPIVSWSKNHRELKLDLLDTRVLVDENNSLIIQNVTSDDEALYSCRATNPHTGRSVAKDSQLLVRSNTANSANEITASPGSPLLMDSGETAKLTCRLSHRANQHTTWLKDNVKIESDHTKYEIQEENEQSSLLIKSVSVNDAGNYTCRVAIPDEKKDLNRTIELRVKDNDLSCQDNTSYTHCKIIALKGLCSKWGKFCCRTCRQYSRSP